MLIHHPHYVVLATLAAAHGFVCKGFIQRCRRDPEKVLRIRYSIHPNPSCFLKVGCNHQDLKRSTRVYSFICAELRLFWATYSGYGEEDGLKGCRVALDHDRAERPDCNQHLRLASHSQNDLRAILPVRGAQRQQSPAARGKALCFG